MAVILAAAMPVRLFHGTPIVGSISVLDALVVGAGITLLLDLGYRRIDVGYGSVFILLSVPLALSVVSVAWSQNRVATMTEVLIYGECLVAYLFVVRELEGLSAERVMTYIKRYGYLLIVPAILLLLHVPGFAPPEDVDPLSGDYTSYYTRLSHPVLGRSNNLASVLAFSAPLLLYWGHARGDRRFTRAGLIVLLAIFATLSRGVLVALLFVAVLYAMAVLPGWRRRGATGGGFAAKAVGASALGAVAIAVLYVVNPPTREFFGDRLTSVTLESRAELTSSAVRAVADRPLLGYGAGASPPEEPPTAEDVAAVLAFTPDAVIAPTVREVPLDVHNTYLQQALYFGLPLGLLVSVALWLLAAVFIMRKPSTPVAYAIGYAVLVQLVVFASQASFEGSVLRVLFYLSLGLAVGLLRAVERDPAAPAVHRP
jgi:O-antigen ligase